MENSIKRIPSGVLVFGLTIVGYTAAYMFQYGYLHYFDIGRVAIEIDIPTLIISILVTLFALISIDNLSDPYRALIRAIGGNEAIQRYKIAQARYWLTVAPTLLLGWYGIGLGHWEVTWIFIIGMGIVLQIEPLGYAIRNKSFKKGLEKYYSHRDNSATTDEGYVSKYVRFIGWAILLFAVSLAAGRYWGSLQIYAYTTADKGNIKEVLIQKYADAMVVKDFDTTKKALLPGFTIKTTPDSVSLSQKIKIQQKK
jgi:hypothetical protein